MDKLLFGSTKPAITWTLMSSSAIGILEWELYSYEHTEIFFRGHGRGLCHDNIQPGILRQETLKLYRDYDGNKVSLNLIFLDNGDEKNIDTSHLEKYPGSVTIFTEEEWQNNRKNEILFLFHRTLPDDHYRQLVEEVEGQEYQREGEGVARGGYEGGKDQQDHHSVSAYALERILVQQAHA